MSRSGYNDDEGDDNSAYLWRGAVLKAIRGKRGQSLIRDLRDALDAMPEKSLVADDLVTPDGQVCALGAVAQLRRVADLEKIDPEDSDHHDLLAKLLNVAPALIREIEYENDDYWGGNESPEKRWERMRRWCDGMLNKKGEPPLDDSPTAPLV